MKRLLITVVFLSLFVGGAFVSAQANTNESSEGTSSTEQKFETKINVINESVTDNGITLNVNSYTVRNNELTIQYTVGHDEKKQYNLDKEVLGEPSIEISGKKIVPKKVTIDKEENGRYEGKAIASLPKGVDVNSDFKISVNEILNQKGSWNINLMQKK